MSEELYKCIPFENLKDGDEVLAFGFHVLRWDMELLGNPAYAFVPANDDHEDIDALRAELAQAKKELEEYKKCFPPSCFKCKSIGTRQTIIRNAWHVGTT